jgi:PAS domain S-box-containing protein
MRPPTILIVDDEVVNREFLSTLLRYRNYRTLQASSGSAALALTRAEAPDLIIADVLMPGMDGYEFVRQLRADRVVGETRVIFYTAAFVEVRARELAASCGVSQMLTKPAEPEAILEAVAAVLGVASAPLPGQAPSQFESEHTRLLTDKLYENVNELTAANELLRASEAQYRSLFEANPLPMWITDEGSSRFLAVNDAAVRQYRYPREEFLAMPLSTLLPVEDSGTRATMHRLKDGSAIEVLLLTQDTSFEGQPSHLVLAQDVTERSRYEQKLKASEQQLRELARRLQSIREEERTRVARQLHDELGQALTALKMNATWIVSRLKEVPPAVQEKIDSSIALVDETIMTVRKLSTELRPGILDLGLAAAIQWQAEEFESRFEIACVIEVETDDEVDLVTATEVFRAFQETLTNVVRHSGADLVEASLRSVGGNLVLEVADSGKGITAEAIASPRALGVLGMRERMTLVGGSFSIGPRAGGGTAVRLAVPLHRSVPGQAV